jgi:glycosyltransferase 2 family protein
MKILIRALIGIAFGALLLWLALSGIDTEQGRQVIGRANVSFMALAVASYWVAIAFRVVRWRILLSSTNLLSFVQVGQALIVGYAVNNVLPARLGEIFRADFLRRRFDVSRSAALGSIIVERLMDGMSVVILLGIGLTAVGSFGNNMALVGAAIAGCALVVIGLAAVYAMIFWHDRLPLRRFPWLEKRIGKFAQGLMVVRGPLLYRALALSAVVWFFEAAAVHLIMRGFGIELAVVGTCLTIGAAALSTLLPSAPGYLGSLQVAFVLAYSALGVAPILGVLSATAVQLLLLGSVTLVGLVMLLLSYFYGAATSVRQLATGDEQRPFGASTH